MILRQELPKDYETVHHLIADSFATAEHSDGNEADLVAALRTGPSFVPALSRVAEVQGEIVGHILLTKAHVGSTTVLALAPLSVKPQFQRQGIGRALILDGHAVAAWAFRMYWSWEAGLIIQGSDTPQRRGFTSKPPRGSLPTISWQSACGKTQVPFTEP